MWKNHQILDGFQQTANAWICPPQKFWFKQHIICLYVYMYMYVYIYVYMLDVLWRFKRRLWFMSWNIPVTALSPNLHQSGTPITGFVESHQNPPWNNGGISVFPWNSSHGLQRLSRKSPPPGLLCKGESKTTGPPAAQENIAWIFKIKAFKKPPFSGQNKGPTVDLWEKNDFPGSISHRHLDAHGHRSVSRMVNWYPPDCSYALDQEYIIYKI